MELQDLIDNERPFCRREKVLFQIVDLIECEKGSFRGWVCTTTKESIWSKQKL